MIGMISYILKKKFKKIKLKKKPWQGYECSWMNFINSLRILEFYVRKTEESTTTHSLTIRTRKF